MDHAARARSARRLVLALAGLWLALGYVNVARGAAHAGARYRFWSFEHLCYSDVIALHGDRYLGGGRPVPYLEDRIEYPVLLGAALWLPSFVPGGALVHFTVTYAALAACLLAALLALDRIPGARPGWLGATPALVLYAGLNWDLLPIALLALAALALARARPGGAGALAALGVSAKLFPGVLVPPALVALAARPPRAPLLRFAGALAVTLLAVNLPVYLAAPDGFLWFFRFNAGRGAENSIWDALHVQRGPLLELLSTGPLLAATAAACAATLATARAGRDAHRAVRLGAALALVAWIATNKIWSPQYALYGFLAGALAAAPLRLFLILSAVSLWDFYVAFHVRALRWEPAFRDHVFHPTGVVRTILWLVLAAWIGRELWRAARPARGDARPRLASVKSGA
ncbi:hypothetical protein [Anaeromyxobacter oryzae]|uniref:DUF2029 domain-containing protein n=1 Tax=Anaeromyxobacter oryzae TaxID=2918170 RepID=A0ABM7WW89_9BACT|nr:hypothetical protein [Anaeromyxobacter oryzae]BDG03710.1 hypothetical protein AMOR_27060 [Anaeromyxobacter oryzae]